MHGHAGIGNTTNTNTDGDRPSLNSVSVGTEPEWCDFGRMVTWKRNLAWVNGPDLEWPGRRVGDLQASILREFFPRGSFGLADHGSRWICEIRDAPASTRGRDNGSLGPDAAGGPWLPLWDVLRRLWTIMAMEALSRAPASQASARRHTTSSRIKAFRTVASEGQGGPGTPNGGPSRTDQPGRARSRARLHPDALWGQGHWLDWNLPLPPLEEEKENLMHDVQLVLVT